MLQVVGLSKSYGSQVLFKDVSFSINAGERIGLVGRNGHGKSTLFRMICGEEEPDSGSIHIPKDYTIGHLSQHLQFQKNTVLEEACLDLPKTEDGWEEAYKAEAILMGLGFLKTDLELHPEKLSGGFQVRLNLARLLASEPQLLLLDEPTNYLDIVSMRWLTNFLSSWKHELLVITHERAFMDSVTTHTIGIHRQQFRKIQGITRKLYQQIELEEEVHEKTRLNQQKEIKKTEQFIRRFRAKASKASAAQSRVKTLARMEKLEKLEEVETLRFEFSYEPFTGKRPLEVKDLSFGYTSEDPLIQNLSFMLSQQDRIAIIGKNGKGKTTLLNLLASEVPPDTGSILLSPHTTMSYFGQTNVERLDPLKTIEEEVLEVHPERNRTAARSICGAMMFSGDLALKKVKVLSGGEKSRVLLGKILTSPSNLLLLDEPTNHLDMYSTEALMEAIEKYPGAVVMVTHSEEMLYRVANRLIVFDDNKVFLFDGNYSDFLSKIGWSEEEKKSHNGTQTGKSADKKIVKKIKSEFRKKRADATIGIQKEIKSLESQIISLEETMKKESEELIEMSRDGFGDDAAKLSRSIHQAKEKIENLFEQMEERSQELQELNEKYDRLLEEALSAV